MTAVTRLILSCHRQYFYSSWSNGFHTCISLTVSFPAPSFLVISRFLKHFIDEIFPQVVSIHSKLLGVLYWHLEVCELQLCKGHHFLNREKCWWEVTVGLEHANTMSAQLLLTSTGLAMEQLRFAWDWIPGAKSMSQWIGP